MTGDALAEGGFGGVLGVAAGSDRPPRLLEVWYEPDGAQAFVAFVGKGITFDSGGLSIKPATAMETMKTDMSGAAAVLAAIRAIARLGIPVKVLGLTPLTDNMPGPLATKPGDVLTTRNGKTIEVLNTDAEGRLVLADALALGVEYEPDLMVDLATLTGACKVALGAKIAGLMGNDDRLVNRIARVGREVGERLWHLPLPDDYRFPHRHANGRHEEHRWEMGRCPDCRAAAEGVRGRGTLGAPGHSRAGPLAQGRALPGEGGVRGSGFARWSPWRPMWPKLESSPRRRDDRLARR